MIFLFDRKRERERIYISTHIYIDCGSINNNKKKLEIITINCEITFYCFYLSAIKLFEMTI